MAGDEFGGDLRLVHKALARLRSLIREIGNDGKGLLRRNFLLSIALPAADPNREDLHIRCGSDLRAD
jgi:hypothetical protein